jgi:peroxiredoxin
MRFERNISSVMELNKEDWVRDRLAALKEDDTWKPDAERGLARLEAARGASRVRGRRSLILGTVLAATAAGLMAFPVTRAFASRCVGVCVAETGRVSRMFWSVRPPAPNRGLAPDFTLADASGKTVQLSSLRGKVVLLNFWATWCGPCKLEIPWFKEFQKSYEDRGLVVLGVSMDEDGWKAVRPYIEAKGVNYRVMVANEDVAKAYGGVNSLPTTLMIDRSGQIASTHVGLTSKPDYEAEIKKMLAE